MEPLALCDADKNSTSTNIISYAKHYKNSAFIDNTHTRARLTALFRDYPGEPVPER